MMLESAFTAITDVNITAYSLTACSARLVNKQLLFFKYWQKEASPHWETTSALKLSINRSTQMIFDIIEELRANTQTASCFHSVGRINGNHKHEYGP